MVLNQIRSLYMASPAVSRLIYIIYLSILKNTISSHLMAAHALKVLVTVIVAVVLCAAVLAPTMAEAGCVDHCGCEPCLAPKGSACTDMCRRPPSCETDCRLLARNPTRDRAGKSDFSTMPCMQSCT